jgi:predicted AAA+ superfamily ATPase
MFPDFHYVSFDDPMTVSKAENAPKQFLEDLRYPVILDEVQYVKDLFRYIKLAIDSKSYETHFYLTGSQQFTMMQNISESLSGRVLLVQLPTLRYEEIKKSFPSLTMLTYLFQGGYPGIYHHNISTAQWYPSYVSSYLERDVRNILNIKDLRDFTVFLQLLATRSGQILNLTSLARDIGKSPNTVKSWISVLITSGIIRLLEPYYRNIGKRLIKSPKLYFTDTGLLSYLLGIKNQESLATSPFVGAIWETYSFNTIVSYFQNLGFLNPPLWFWRTPAGAEVDFVMEQNNQIILLESKWKARVDIHDTAGFAKFKTEMGSDQVILSQIIAPVPELSYIAPDIIVHDQLTKIDIL